MNDQESYLSTKLYSVIQERNLEKVKLLLKSGADVNEKNNSELAPIHLAILTGDLRFLKILVEHGADLDAQDLYGYTALHLAVLNNDLKTADYLISNGANISVTAKGVSPLMHSYYSNSVEMFKLLIKEANQKTKANLLIEAAYHNRISMIEILLDNEANADARYLDMTRLSALTWVFGPQLANEMANRSCLEIALKDNIGMFKMISFLK